MSGPQVCKEPRGIISGGEAATADLRAASISALHCVFRSVGGSSNGKCMPFNNFTSPGFLVISRASVLD